MAGSSVTLVFRVGLPPVELSPNGRVHRLEKARAAREYRTEARIMGIGARVESRWKVPDRARVSLHFGLLDRRARHVVKTSFHPRDVDNAVGACKALIDGLRDAELIVDDNWAALELGSVTATFEDGPWVEVRIERV